ncbi:unnamed protein product [Paramecium primaurelia]|uniref:Protein kinase domain-containing protein n=1 Tax=Paramecium primaurelia TaxID=5886 RepID=A0A8S1MZQ9_PARPR|nr:unnamed protein product [Paramecium primaurelia]
MLKQIKLSKSESNDSVNQSFLANVEKYKQSKTDAINIYDLNSIKLQADVILKNIENQINKCSQWKSQKEQHFSLNTTQTTGNQQQERHWSSSINKKIQQSRPFSALSGIAPRIKRVEESKVKDKIESQQQIIEKCIQPQKQPKTTLDLNQLCNQELLMGNFKLETILGSGSFAMVRMGVDKNTKEKYAIKIYEKIKLNDSQKMNNVKREISILKRIEHQNIIKLYWAIEDKKSINLVMEYISSQSLASYIKSKPNRILPEKECLTLFYQIAMAIKYLHDLNISHRDIKLDNVLMLKTNVIKLIDFGFAICMPQNQKTNVFCGTPHYMSPEIIAKIPHHPFSSDIWSLGILLSKMLTGEYPFKGQNDKDLYRQIQCQKLKTNQDKKINENIMRIINGCLEKNIQNRWNINQIINDPVFHNDILIPSLKSF